MPARDPILECLGLAAEADDGHRFCCELLLRNADTTRGPPPLDMPDVALGTRCGPWLKPNDGRPDKPDNDDERLISNTLILIKFNSLMERTYCHL